MAAAPAAQSPLSDAFKRLANTLRDLDSASTSARAKLEALEKELDAAQAKAAEMATQLAGAELRIFQTEFRCELERMARIEAQGAFRKLEESLQTREEKIRADEEEIRRYREGLQEDLNHTVRKIKETADLHAYRLSQASPGGLLKTPRALSSSDEDEPGPPSKRTKIQATPTSPLSTDHVIHSMKFRGFAPVTTPSETIASPVATPRPADATPAGPSNPKSSEQGITKSASSFQSPKAIRRSTRKVVPPPPPPASVTPNAVASSSKTNL
ncbi:hypothetical protein C8R47DRAFT_289499 [Mycena vitilis]|nr:hypothetical protein C8R47DRAFT_289499 [Mycena vitilis]